MAINVTQKISWQLYQFTVVEFIFALKFDIMAINVTQKIVNVVIPKHLAKV